MINQIPYTICVINVPANTPEIPSGFNVRSENRSDSTAYNPITAAHRVKDHLQHQTVIQPKSVKSMKKLGAK